MKSEKGQSLVMVGVALFLLAGLCLYLGLSQPKISSGVLVETPTTAVQSGTTTQSAAATVGRSAASSTATAAQTAASGNAGTVSYPVNLNTATFEELTAIQGIGDQRAAAIWPIGSRLANILPWNRSKIFAVSVTGCMPRSHRT